MALLQPQSPEDTQRARTILQRYGYTTLASAEGPPILAVSDELLEELNEQGVAFDALTDESVKERLSDKGLSYYEFLLEHNPNAILFEASLPPAMHLALSVTVPDYLIPAATQCIAPYSPISIEHHEITRLDTGTAQAMTRLDVVIHRSHKDALLHDLATNQIAGYSRETMVIIQSDPDAPSSRD